MRCGLASFKAHVAPGTSLTRREKRADSGRLGALGTRACPCAGGRPTATRRAFWSSSHGPGRSGAPLSEEEQGVPCGQSPCCPRGRVPENLLAGSSRQRGWWGARPPQIPPQMREMLPLACPPVCGRHSGCRLTPAHAVPGFLLPAARLRPFPLTDLNDASQVTGCTCGFEKKSLFVKSYLSWHKIIGKYHGYLNKTHQK